MIARGGNEYIVSGGSWKYWNINIDVSVSYKEWEVNPNVVRKPLMKCIDNSKVQEKDERSFPQNTMFFLYIWIGT